MTSFRRVSSAAALFAAVFLAGPAAAQASRTWVSGVGDDANPCSRTAPCKTFAGALANTADGGEISVLDAGGFGAVTIDRALTIDGNGHVAGVLAAGTAGIVVDAPAGSDVVLRNLSLEGVSGATSGIRYVGGRSLTVENVSVRGFARGISFDGGTGVAGRLRVLGSHLEANGTGIFLQPMATSTVRATIARTQLVNNGAGLRAESGSRASVATSTVSGNTNAGVNVVAPAGTPAASVSVNDSVVAGSGVGLKATQANATVIVSASTVSDNATGLQAVGGGTITSFGDNQVVGNGVDGQPTGTTGMR